MANAPPPPGGQPPACLQAERELWECPQCEQWRLVGPTERNNKYVTCPTCELEHVNPRGDGRVYGTAPNRAASLFGLRTTSQWRLVGLR